MGDRDVTFVFDGIGARTFELPETDSEHEPLHVFGVKKGGSTLLARVVRDLAPFGPRTLWEPAKVFFETGLPMYRCVHDVDKALTRVGYVYSTFRWLPENWLFDLHGDAVQRGILLVRDPRDMLVSLYFSDMKSHALPESGPLRRGMQAQREQLQEGELVIDEYVLEKAPQFLRNYLRTLQLLTVDGIRLLRYEDIIYDKRRLVDTVAELLDAEAGEDTLAKIADKHDVRPDSERPGAHIRQINPGNHREKLADDTIAALDERFAPVLSLLGYAHGG